VSSTRPLLSSHVHRLAAAPWMIWLVLSGNREVFLFRGRRDRSQGRLDDAEAFFKLFVRDDQGHENAYHVAVRPGRNGNQQFITCCAISFVSLSAGSRDPRRERVRSRTYAESRMSPTMALFCHARARSSKRLPIKSERASRSSFQLFP